MNIYKNDYLNMDKIINLPYTFIFIVGGRGIGKTFGALDYVVRNNIKTILLRRTQSQLDIINKAEFAPIKPICDNIGYSYHVSPITKQSAGYYINEDNLPLITTAAVSTISNMRGFDATDREIIIYDEFISERHERPIKNEAEAVLNAYETINRNRELSGHKPVKFIALANSNDIMNPLFIYLKLINPVSNMIKRGAEMWADENRNVCVIMPQRSPISDKKLNTSLYKLAGDSDFRNMAIENEFSNAENENIKNYPLREFCLKYTIGELNIYEHKSNNTMYCSLHKSGTPRKHYEYKEDNLISIRRELLPLICIYISKKIYFENVYALALFKKIFAV